MANENKHTWTSLIFGFFIVVFFIGMVGIFYFMKMDFNYSENYDKTVEFYSNKEITGVIIDKYFDKNDHDSRKIILSDGHKTTEFDLSFEKLEQYEFFQIGDSIIKERDSLNIHVKRTNLDTTVVLKFENLKKE